MYSDGLHESAHVLLRALVRAGSLGLIALCCVGALCQTTAPRATAAASSPAAPLKDPLGRTTPRGTVLGFLIAARKGDSQVAAQYLNTRASTRATAALADQLFVVLDRRLPARLNELGDVPEGPPTDPLNPNQYFVGTIRGTNFGIFLERIEKPNAPPIWLFSADTLKSIPDLYEDTKVTSIEDALPSALVNTRIVDIPLYEWLTVLVGLPLFYLLTAGLDRILTPSVGWLIRRLPRHTHVPTFRVVPPPVRLLLLALMIRLLLSRVGVSLIARQFWYTTSTVLTVGACAWLLIVLNGQSERFIRARLQARNLSGAASIQRLLRRAIDLALIVAALLVLLEHFGVNITAALAGLGVGGIAIALAAQKTLENVIGGASIIIDQAVRVGDFLKLGETMGTVEDIGLRSTRIRTLDRTIINIPNGQIATMSLEVISARDKYWFHPTVSVRYDTPSVQLGGAVEAIRRLLASTPRVDSKSLRVRFFRIGSSSLDIEVFAYVLVREWEDFLEVQEQLLHGILRTVEDAGTRLAIPSQTMYFRNDAGDGNDQERSPRPLMRGAAHRMHG